MATIPQFFAGKSVFITGPSGFLGKVLIEKLLRSCPDVEAIYVLIRDKNGETAEERFNKILEEKLFEDLHTFSSKCFSRVQVIRGDLLANKIISNDDDLATLQNKVQVVIHAAASVRFSEPIRRSVHINLRGTYKVLEFAKTLKNIESVIHVSTAYSNCHLREVEEKIYKCGIEPTKLMALCEWMDDDVLEKLRARFLNGRPNTYTFTKALAENLVEQYSAELPVAIVRPSIITGAAYEPLPGWVDNHKGPSGLLIALGTGALTTLYSNLDCTADLIPVDFVANTILAAATRCVADGFKIYNSTTGTQNPINWRKFMDESIDFPHEFPTTSVMRYPQPRITCYKSLHQARLYVQHYLPAKMIDVVLRCARKQPFAARLYDRLSNSMELLEFFTTNEWSFDNTNTQTLFESLPPIDKAEFNFDASTIDWSFYVHCYCDGIRQYVMKEDIGDLEKARIHLRRLKYLHYALSLSMAVGVWMTTSTLLSWVDNFGFP